MGELPQDRIAVSRSPAATERSRSRANMRRTAGLSTSRGRIPGNRFKLADMKAKLDVAHAYLDRCVQAALAGDSRGRGGRGQVVGHRTSVGNRGPLLQLHGGYGYINEYEIARLWRDARVQRLYGGTTEIMKEIVGRSLGF